MSYEDFNGNSLQLLADWIDEVLRKHPDARVETYESVLISAHFDELENTVTTS